MKPSLYFRQTKPITAYMLGGLLIIVAISLMNGNDIVWSQIATLAFIALVLFGYSISYEITSDFKNSRHFKFFGLTLFKNKLDIAFPDYITIFAVSFKQGAEWGPVAAMGKNRNGDGFVIRLFKGNKYFTVFRTKSLKVAKEKALALSQKLGVEVADNT